MNKKSRGLARYVGGSVSATALAAAMQILSAGPASALPAFAIQTGQACEACHVGGFGPQLTPFGRNFKLHGYTMRTNTFNVPFSAMVMASYVNTAKAQTSAPADGYGLNNNFSLDQLSFFLAGGLGQHLGAFVQATYDGVGKSWHWDNLDVRATTTATIKGVDTVFGLDINNAPSVQDVFNTVPAWGFPYTTSSLAPGGPGIIMGAFAQNTIGVTGYAWIDSQFYVEAGGYQSPSSGFLTHAGIDPTSPGSIKGTAPYARVAWQKGVGPATVSLGGFFMDAHINPGSDISTGLTDHYTDLGLDGSVELPAANRDMFTVNARYTHERQNLLASQALELSQYAGQNLQDFRIDASYYWRSKVGLTVAAFDTWGSADPILYGSNGIPQPDTSGLMFQIDGTPFGSGDGPLGKRFNIRVGLQYTDYLSYNGSAHNYDQAGRNASDNNTVRLFLWAAY